MRRRSPDAAVYVSAVARGGRPAVGVVQSLLRHAAANLADRGWSDADVRHVVKRRLSAMHADVVLGVGGVGPVIVEAVGVLLEALALVVLLPEISAVAEQKPEDLALGGLDQRILTRVRGLLRKAESTEFPEEAEALTAKAQELIARHAIDAVVLGAAPGEIPMTRRVYLDDPYIETKAMLLDRVAGANRCAAVFAPWFGWSDVFGYLADLDAVELLTQSLLAQATRALAREGSRVDATGRSRTRSFRRSFLAGFALRIGERLQRATNASVAAAGAMHSDLLPVLASRDEQAEALRARTYPMAEARRTSISNGSGWVAGRAAAEVADLSVTTRAVPARET